MQEQDNGYINSSFEQENDEKQEQISQSQIGEPIKLVEVKAPQTATEITFPKAISFSEPITGASHEDIFDKENSAVFPEIQEESYFINKKGMKDFSAMDEHADRWAAYRTTPEPKKKNWIPGCIAVALILGLVVGFGTMFEKLQFAEKEQFSALITLEETAETPEIVEEINVTESVEVPLMEEDIESVEAESTAAMESTQASSFTREPLVMEESKVKSFIEDSENIGYGVTYDAERAEQMLDELEALYEQMPERKK